MELFDPTAAGKENVIVNEAQARQSLTPRWRPFVASAALCALLLGIAYVIIIGVRDRRWDARAEQQAADFVYASPVLSGYLGPIASIKSESARLGDSTPATCDVTMHIQGHRSAGTVAIELTRDGPEQWLVSSARLQRGRQSTNLL